MTSNHHDASPLLTPEVGRKKKPGPIGINRTNDSSFTNGGYDTSDDLPSSIEVIQHGGLLDSSVYAEPSIKKVEEKEPVVPFHSLYRFATFKDIVILVTGAICAVLGGFISPIGNKAYGDFAKAMVKKGAELSNGTCNETDENFLSSFGASTDPFILATDQYVIIQISLGGIQLLLGYLMVMCYNIVAENQVYNLRINYFKALLSQDIGWFDAQRQRNFSVKIVEDMLKIQTALSEKIPLTIFSFTTFIFMLATSFYYGWKLSLVMSAMIPLVFIVVTGRGIVSSYITKTEQESYASAGAVAEEVIANIKTVVAFNGQEKEAARYNKELEKAKHASFIKGILLGVSNGSGWLMYFLNYSLAFWYGTILVLKSREEHNEEYGPDTLIIVLFGLIVGSWTLGHTGEYFEAIGAGKGAAQGIFPVLNRQSPISGLTDEGYRPTEKAVGEIEFENVCFAYPSRPEVEILRNFSLKIKPQTTVAFVGRSGSGKSTCIQLLQRFYDPTAGSIKIDGMDIKSLNVAWLRNQIGIVSQEPLLFNGTIETNIKLGCNGSTTEEMLEASDQACAHDFIQRLPQKYDTLTGERGAQLSGGEKQRIAISRALIRSPPILLLDEATSALDMQSERLVQQALDRAKSGRTTIIIAHRLSTVRAADLIVVLSNGKVVECGTHDDLMQLKGTFYELVNAQEEFETTEKISKTMLAQKGIGDIRTEELYESPKVKQVFSTSSEHAKSEPIKSVVEIHQEEKVMKEQFKMKDFIILCSTEWKSMGAATLFTVIKSIGLPFYSIIFGSYIALFSSSDNDYIRRMGNLYSLIFLLLAILMGIMSLFQRIFANMSEYGLTLRIRKRLFRTILYQDAEFFDEEGNHVGQLTSRLSADCTSIQGTNNTGISYAIQAAGSRLVGLTQALTIVTLSAIMSFYFLPKMAAVTIFLVPIVLFSSFLEGRILESGNVTERESIESAANVAVEALNSIRTVQGLGIESHFINQYIDSLQLAHKINLKRAHIRGVIFGFVYAVPYFAYALSVFYGAYLVRAECASVADVFRVAEALIFGTMSGGAALAFAPDYDKGKIGAARIMKLLRRKPKINSEFQSGGDIARPEGDVEYSRVKFFYPSRPTMTTLRNFSLRAESGKSIAIVGPSGSGKSTIAALLMRHYDPVGGVIMLDKEDLKLLNVFHMRSHLGIVAQEPVLFDMTIRENIAYGAIDHQVSDEEIIEAAKAANIHDFIVTLPDGYNTRTGSSGSQLSGGQKQRVAIARALLRSPKVLILDEATSALDSHSEKVVQDALDRAKEGRTCITIAHRLSSIKNYDLIVVVRDGRIIESGSHNELLSSKGLYLAMWSAQMKPTVNAV